MTLESLKTYPLKDVTYFWRDGRISDDVYEAYLHLWQTSALRFTRQCWCAECRKVDW
jgi:hypothetical protein